MGSLENGATLKKAPLLRSGSSIRGDRHSFLHRPRSRFARFLLFEKVDYLQWICTIAVFFFVIILFQAFLPGSVLDKSGGLLEETATNSGNWMFLKNMGELDFGEGIEFEPSKLLDKFQREAREVNSSSILSRPRVRSGVRKPQLALVLADLSVDPEQLLMVSIAVSLQELGYTIQVYSLEDGPVHVVWRNVRMPVTIVNTVNRQEITVDWLMFAVSEALKRMYGVSHDWNSLPPMPMDGDTWPVMQSWVLPTRSFVEFVMFSRMFVDALDAQMYDEHHQNGH